MIPALILVAGTALLLALRYVRLPRPDAPPPWLGDDGD